MPAEFSVFSIPGKSAGLIPALGLSVTDAAEQLGVALAHAFDPHAVGHIGPFKELGFRHAGEFGKRFAAFGCPRRLKKFLGCPDALGLEARGCPLSPSISLIGYVMTPEIQKSDQ